MSYSLNSWKGYSEFRLQLISGLYSLIPQPVSSVWLISMFMVTYLAIPQAQAVKA